MVQVGKPTIVREMQAVLDPAGALIEDAMPKVTVRQFIESTAGQVAAELARRGISPEQHVTITIEPDDWLMEARRFARPKVTEAGLSDDTIDRLIKQAQAEVEPLLRK